MDNMAMIVRYSRYFSERKLKEYELSFSEQIILMYLSIHGSVNQETIAKRYMIDKGMIAKTINKLDKKDFIIKKQNLENKRENVISLSEKGKSILVQMADILKEWNEILYQNMSKEEIDQVSNLTKKLATNVVNYMEERKLEDMI